MPWLFDRFVGFKVLAISNVFCVGVGFLIGRRKTVLLMSCLLKWFDPRYVTSTCDDCVLLACCIWA